MKHEFDRRHRLSSDIFADADATKILCELLCEPCNENCIQGFVQRIDRNPFGMLFISDIQVISSFINGQMTL
jgi:hypothetical protein